MTTDADGVAAQRVSGPGGETSRRRGKILTGGGLSSRRAGITAGQFDEIQVEIELAKDKAEEGLPMSARLPLMPRWPAMSGIGKSALHLAPSHPAAGDRG